MKKENLLTIVLALFTFGSIYAQSPDMLNYQAVARDGDGNILQNKNVLAVMAVYSGSGGSTLVYEEEHNVVTDSYGMFSLKIGDGSATTGNFGDIDWGSGPHFLQVQLDIGDGLVNLGKTQFVSVPYAKYAEQSGDKTWDLDTNDAYYNDGNVGIGTVPKVKMHAKSEGMEGVLGSQLGIDYNPNQFLAPAIYGRAQGNAADLSFGLLGKSYSNNSSFNMGVFGEGGGGTTNNYGIYGVDYGESGSNYSIAVYGDNQGNASTNYAGYFAGDVEVTGTLNKGGGSFKIDHPNDPENKYLYHSFVESPDMMNVYNGNVTTGADGVAKVELPDYFQALNKDFRYQLTVIGEFAEAIVYEEIQGNHFKIKTDKPNVKVSWQVTGVREDAWAEKNRIKPVQEKKGVEKGKYLHPEAHSRSEDEGLPTGAGSNK